MVATPDLPQGHSGFAVDPGDSLYVAPAAGRNVSAKAIARFPTLLVGISLLLHMCLLAALVLFERAPEQIRAPAEIPVELVTEPPPPRKEAAPEGKPAESAPASPQGEKRKARQDPPEPPPQDRERKPAAQAKPAERPAPPIEKREARPNPTKVPTKAAERKAVVEPKPVFDKSDSGSKHGSEPKPAERSAAASRGAQKPRAESPVSPDVPARYGDGGTRLAAQAGLSLPMDLGPPIFRAVAMPLPVEGGDEPVNYKLLVFGMLERAKHCPEDAIKRGARGVATILFSLDDAGEVVSASLVRSSGEADLDAEGVALVARAAPFPAPPPGAQRTFAADIFFGMGQ
jgi:colicin import membrane protein